MYWLSHVVESICILSACLGQEVAPKWLGDLLLVGHTLLDQGRRADDYRRFNHHCLNQHRRHDV